MKVNKSLYVTMLPPLSVRSQSGWHDRPTGSPVKYIMLSMFLMAQGYLDVTPKNILSQNKLIFNISIIKKKLEEKKRLLISVNTFVEIYLNLGYIIF